MSLGIKPRHPTRCGRRTSPISKSLAGVGSTCRPFLTITVVTSSHGSCAPTWWPVMLPKHWSWLYKLQDVINFPTTFITNRACCWTMNQATLQMNWPNGSMTMAWIMSVVRRIIRKQKPRSNDGTRPSKTVSCWKTTFFQVT